MAKQEGYLTLSDVDFAVSQLHNLLKGSCFWPQVMGMRNSLSNEEQDYLIKETVSMFLSRYQAS